MQTNMKRIKSDSENTIQVKKELWDFLASKPEVRIYLSSYYTHEMEHLSLIGSSLRQHNITIDKSNKNEALVFDIDAHKNSDLKVGKTNAGKANSDHRQGVEMIKIEASDSEDAPDDVADKSYDHKPSKRIQARLDKINAVTIDARHGKDLVPGEEICWDDLIQYHIKKHPSLPVVLPEGIELLATIKKCKISRKMKNNKTKSIAKSTPAIAADFAENRVFIPANSETQNQDINSIDNQFTASIEAKTDSQKSQGKSIVADISSLPVITQHDGNDSSL